MNRPKVSIVILNWNQENDTSVCLDSLKALAYDNYEVILVDNGSKNGSPDRIKKRFPDTVLIKNDENLGFAEGNNTGMRYALRKGADYIFLLNNDTAVDKDVLNELLRVAESDKSVGVVGAVNYSFDYPDRAVLVYTSFNWFTGFTKKEKLDDISNGVITEPQEAHGVTGSSLLIKREVIEKIGLLDKRFFIYYEDTDWCMRARRAGYKVMYVPRAGIRHKVSVTFGQKTALEYYLYTRNLPLFMVKNCPKICLPSFFLFYILKISVYCAGLMLTGRFRHAQGLFFGFADFCTGRFFKGRLEALR